MLNLPLRNVSYGIHLIVHPIKFVQHCWVSKLLKLEVLDVVLSVVSVH